MKLNRRSVEYYDPRPSTDPIVLPGAWSASFDDGTTWVPVEVVDDLPKWLLAGPQAEDPGMSVATISKTTYPLLRISDAPEAVVVQGPKISLV